MKNLTLGLLLLSIISVLSCAALSSKGTSISGTISDAPNMKVFLDKVGPNNNTMVLAQTDTDANGDFSLKVDETLPPAIYRLRIGTGKIFLVVEDEPSSLTVKSTLESMRTHEVDIKGSESAKNFAEAMNLLSTQRINLDDVKDYIKNTQYPLAGMQLAMNALGNRPEFFDLHKSAVAAIAKKYPNHEYIADYTTFVNALEQAAMQTQATEAIQVGMPAPEISLKSPDGKKYSLSDLKGKVVLLDFGHPGVAPAGKLIHMW